MGPSRFCDLGLTMNIERSECSIQGNLVFGTFKHLRSDIMGPFRLISDMECAHGVISMAHRLEGILNINGECFDFSDGMGYIETDRGHSFPNAYLWTQCTWHEDQPASLMLSVATIPLAKTRFTGCICAVIHRGKEHRLATYCGARVEEWSRDGAVIRQGKYRLEVEVPGESSQPLRAPVSGSMQRTIRESLCTRARYRFWAGKELLFEHTDRCASFEFSDGVT